MFFMHFPALQKIVQFPITATLLSVLFDVIVINI